MITPLRALALILALTAAPARAAVGFQHLLIPNPQGPPIEVGIWYPTDARATPTRVEAFVDPLAADAPVAGRGLALVVMSHGLGGSYGGHHDTAEALANAGFVAAALTHTGDNWRKGPRTVGYLADRPRELGTLVDYMLSAWPDRNRIDPGRIGAFGFSLGGFTVLTAAGGEPDLRRIAEYCRAYPDRFDCTVRGEKDHPPQPRAWTHEPRIRAVVAAAPAIAYSFGRDGLAKVAQPVQLWRADHDDVVVASDLAEAALAGLPRRDARTVGNAEHFDFLAPCSAALRFYAPDICASRPGFDRAAFHREFNEAVVAFFRDALKP